MKIEELQAVREWAHGKIKAGAEPPWAWYQYMKLIETLDAIIAGMGAVADLPASSGDAGHLRVVSDESPVIPVQLPM